MKIIYTSLLTLSLLAATAARAAEISYTQDVSSFTNNATINLNKFNTSLGTLTGVTLSWSINSNVGATLTNLGTNPVIISSVKVNNDLSVYAPATSANPSAPLQTDDFVQSTTISGSHTLAANGGTYTYSPAGTAAINDSFTILPSDSFITSFEGSGTVPIYMVNSFGININSNAGGNAHWDTLFSGSAHGTATVTYDYTASPVSPVPEPSGLVLGSGALVFLSAVGGLLKMRLLGV